MLGPRSLPLPYCIPSASRDSGSTRIDRTCFRVWSYFLKVDLVSPGYECDLRADLETFLLKMTETWSANGNGAQGRRGRDSHQAEKTLRFSLDTCKEFGVRQSLAQDGASKCGLGSGTTRIGWLRDGR